MAESASFSQDFSRHTLKRDGLTSLLHYSAATIEARLVRSGGIVYRLFTEWLRAGKEHECLDHADQVVEGHTGSR